MTANAGDSEEVHDLWRTAAALLVHLSRRQDREVAELTRQALAEGKAGDLLEVVAWIALGAVQDAFGAQGPALEYMLLTQAAALGRAEP